MGQELGDAIEGIHADVKHRYGSPRMTTELNARGHECSENTVAELMRGHGIRATSPRRFVRTTDSSHRFLVAENILGRAFEPERPNGRWCADITYIPTSEGWLHSAVVEQDRGLVDGPDGGEPAGVSRPGGVAGISSQRDFVFGPVGALGPRGASARANTMLDAQGIVCSMSSGSARGQRARGVVLRANEV
ncbi:IS3 family transposase [Gemmata sp. G18]|uniref:IS3 family transposase n=1 Tax=Gemmata palustris TaxID=2822762 RepID=A0ABS5C7H4_9BACT|nr:IS3 family transposase [Gemmata palustris]